MLSMGSFVPRLPIPLADSVAAASEAAKPKPLARIQH